MGICLSGDCVVGCPDWIITLAGIGGLVMYILFGVLIFAMVKSFKDDIEIGWIVFFIIFWPLIIAGGIIAAVLYYIVRLITFPIVGVDKFDLKDFERKVDNKIALESNKIEKCLKENKSSKRGREKPEKSIKGKPIKKGKKRSKR